MSTDMEFHEAANIFPMMSDEEANGLLEDIRKNGLQKPIETFEGKIIDGRNRYLACLKLGPDFDYEYTEMDDMIDDPVAYVLSANLHRRQLTASQKSIVTGKAKKLIEALKAEAKLRQKARKGNQPGASPVTLPDLCNTGDTRDKLGKLAGISGSMVDRGCKVVEKAAPELTKAVEEGRISVTNAAKLTDMGENIQRQAAEDAKFTGGRFSKLNIAEENQANPDHSKTKNFALQCARCAITQIERIPKSNPGREEAFAQVEKWIQTQRTK